MSSTAAASGIDPFAPELATAPYGALAELRELAPAVYLTRHDCWILTRYEDVRAAARDWGTFSSAHGVALLEPFNAMTPRSVLVVDPPEHKALRSVLSGQLAPRAIGKLSADIHARAERLVADVVRRRDFDGVTDLAKVLPVDIVADLIGLPEHGRDKLLPGADAIFTTFGPMTPALEERMPLIEQYTQYMNDVTSRRQLRPGSWGAAILDAIDDGRLAPGTAVPQMSSYLVAGMDTTVNGISAMLHAFAADPRLWKQLRAEPALAGPIFEETLRVESPVQGFFRQTTCEAVVDGSRIPAGARVMLHFGAANRDGRHYPRPESFDPRRNPVDHLAFGHGMHTCAGLHLARLEAAAVIAALLPRVSHFELAGQPRQHYNPVVRGLETLPLHVELS